MPHPPLTGLNQLMGSSPICQALGLPTKNKTNPPNPQINIFLKIMNKHQLAIEQRNTQRNMEKLVTNIIYLSLHH